MSSQLDTLTQINLDDLVSSFGWQDQPLPAAIVRRLFYRPARKFAGQMVEYDCLVEQVGLHRASCEILQKHYIQGLSIHGHENIPARGPVLFLSNHPGMADTLSLFAAIQRDDLRIIALNRPFLASLPNVSRHLFYIGDHPGERISAVRQVSTYLRAGGTVLTFPAGKIEPDPEVHSGALDSLKEWTDSSAIFTRFVPDLKIVPVLVSGVIWERTAHHWLTRFKRTREDRERLSAALQLLAILAREARPTTAHVQFASPITRAEISPADPQCIHEKLMERMRSLIENKTKEDGARIL